MLIDLTNVLFILVIIFVAFLTRAIPGWLAFFLAVFSLTPFFLNDVLFPASLMSDQFKYLKVVQGVRDINFDFEFSPTVELSGTMLAFVPLPFIESLYSLGLCNRLIAVSLVIWLYSSKHLRGWPLLFVLFYPSFLLYSSLALRDTLVLFWMLTSVILFLEKRLISAFFLSVPLLFIKFQNFFLLLVFFLIHLGLTRGNIVFKTRVLLFPFLALAIIPFMNQLVETIDFFRRALFIEDGGEISSYAPISGFTELAGLALQSVPYFLLKPLFWEVENFLQALQSIENFALAGFLYFLFSRALLVDRSITLKWLVFLIVSFGLYGLVVFNFGTAVRYKFPFLVVAAVGLAYEIHLKHAVALWGKNKLT